MEARGVWKGGFETELSDGRGHVVTVDLPRSEGGHDWGPSALELGVLSLAGCITTIFCLVAKKRKLSFRRLSVHLTADRPTRAPTVQRVHGTVEVGSDAPKEEVETTLALTLKTCPMGVLFEQAHVPVEVTLSVVPP